MKRKIFSIILTFSILAATMPCTVRAESYNGLFYKVEYDGSVTITGCDENTSGAITIPDEINGLPVLSIMSGAFQGCTSLTSVTISDGVVVIGRYAFGGCTSLTDIKIPKSVAGIALGAFSDTGYYNDERNWNNDVLYIGNYLIEARNEINGNYTIKNGTRVIAESAFSGCGNLKAITIPDGVAYIGDYAFRDCTSLTDIKIPDGVTEIKMGTFYGCSSLTSITIPESMMYIDEAAFRNCSSLKDVYYGGSEDNWLNVEIEGLNDLYWIGATIHYEKFDLITPALLIITPRDGEYELTADTEYDGTAYAATYDAEGVLLNVISVPFTNGTASITPETAGAADIKFFVWTSAAQPITNSEEKRL